MTQAVFLPHRENCCDLSSAGASFQYSTEYSSIYLLFLRRSTKSWPILGIQHLTTILFRLLQRLPPLPAARHCCSGAIHIWRLLVPCDLRKKKRTPKYKEYETQKKALDRFLQCVFLVRVFEASRGYPPKTNQGAQISENITF